MDEYTIRGREIFSPKGKLVATLDDDGNPVMAPGMAGPHSRGVREFLADVEGRRSKVEGGDGENAGVRGPSQGAERGADAADRESDGSDKSDGARGAEGADTGEPKPGNRKPETREATVEDIPEDRLPPFSPEFGTATPGFAEFVARHKLTPEQIGALVKRCEGLRTKD